MLYTLACGGVLLLAFLLATNPLRVNRLANGWLSVFLLCFGCALLGRALPATASGPVAAWLPGLLELTRLAMAPALYLSVVQFTAPARPVRAADALHFVPWLLFLLLMLPRLLGYASGPALPAWAAPTVRGLVLATPKVQAVAYWLAAYLRLARHQRHLPLITAQPEPGQLRWLQRLLWGLAGLVLLWLNELLGRVGWVLALAPAAYLGAVGYLAYYALRQPEVFAFSAPVRAELQALLQAHDQAGADAAPPAPVAGAAPAPGRQARLSPSQLAHWQQRLRQLLATEKPYLQPDLSLPALAQLAGLSTHELSYVLNEGFGLNFFQLINGYRVEEAKRLLLSARHQHLSVLGIGFEAGFSSKTTFNTAFKKVTGLSPSEFQRDPALPADDAAAPFAPPLGTPG